MEGVKGAEVLNLVTSGKPELKRKKRRTSQNLATLNSHR